MSEPKVWEEIRISCQRCGRAHLWGLNLTDDQLETRAGESGWRKPTRGVFRGQWLCPECVEEVKSLL